MSALAYAADERAVMDALVAAGGVSVTSVAFQGFASHWLGQKAWPGYLHPTARAAHALKSLRKRGMAECFGTNGMWRFTEAGCRELRAISATPATRTPEAAAL